MITLPPIPNPDQPNIVKFFRRLPNGDLIEILTDLDADPGERRFSKPGWKEGDGRGFSETMDSILEAVQSVANEAGVDGPMHWPLPSGRVVTFNFQRQTTNTAATIK